MDMMMQRLKSRTYWAAIILAALTIVEAKYDVVATLVSADWKPWLPLIFPVVMLICREITKTALEDK